MSYYKKKHTITLTWGDVAENHFCMQNTGKISKNGFTTESLQTVKSLFEEKNYICKLYNLNETIKKMEDTGLFTIDKAEVLLLKKE